MAELVSQEGGGSIEEAAGLKWSSFRMTMKQQRLGGYRSRFAVARFANDSSIAIVLLAAFLLLLISSHFIHEHYGGIGVDERAEWYNVNMQLIRGVSFIKTGKPEDVTQEYYGVANTLIPYLLAIKLRLPLRGYYHLTHIFSVACGIATAYLLWWASDFCQIRNRWLAPVMLFASPAFFGYSLMNIKDIPIALAYTLFTCSLLWHFNQINAFSSGRHLKGVLIVSIAAGTFASLRLTLLPVAVATFVIANGYCLFSSQQIMVRTNFRGRPANHLSLKILLFLISTLIFCVATCLVSILLLPGSWDNPVSFFMNAFNTFRDYTVWDGCTLYMGQCTSKLSTKGWTTAGYLLKWWFAQPTLLNIFNSIVGIPLVVVAIASLPRAENGNQKRQIGIILFSVQAYLVVALAIATNATLYNGVRHLLFIFPAIAFLGSMATDKICILRFQTGTFLPGLRLANIYCAIIFITIIASFIDMAGLAPYQYSYINELQRQRLTAGTTELEVWDTSLGELYLKHKDLSPLFPSDPNKSLILTRESLGIHAPATDGKKLQQLIRTPVKSPIANLPPGCRLVSQVDRSYISSGQNIIFSAVTECSAAMPSLPK